jgi:2-oxoglutarate dehydrogenase E2 component (dihydrolipoamide succinyltransferase)
MEIKVPPAGESVTKGILATWLIEEGAFVEEGEIVFEIETDKASMEVPATGSGMLHRLVDEGCEVTIGQVVGTLTEGEAEKPQISESESAPKKTEIKLSPAVKRLVDEHTIDPNGINGTG